MKGINRVYQVDCTENRNVCNKFHLQREVQMVVFPADNRKAGATLDNDLSAKFIIREITSRMISKVVQVRSDNFEETVRKAETEGKPLFLLFTLRKTTSPLFMSLANVSLRVTGFRV